MLIIKEMYTGQPCWPEEDAKALTKKWSKILGEYWTYLKGEPIDTRFPEECYYITNKFDPIVRRDNALN